MAKRAAMAVKQGHGCPRSHGGQMTVEAMVAVNEVMGSKISRGWL
jgi:hypothetical protein